MANMKSNPDLYVQNKCIILAIDPAEVSGWCIWSPKGHLAYGEVSTFSFAKDDNVEEVVRLFLNYAEECKLPMSVVAEKWTHHGLSHAAYAGLCSTWGVWKLKLEEAGITKRKVTRLYPQTWRSRVLGKHVGSREQLKMMSINMASRLVGDLVDSHNAADAICIARWAQNAMDVAKKLPKRKAKVGAL